SDLGAGFRIATYDLELRGGGNLLGDSQSGHIAAVGLELYTELLEEAVHELKGEAWHERIDPEVNLGLEAHLPDDYVPDVGEKINFYKKLSNALTDQELQDVADELIDCHGPPGEPVKNLLGTLQVGVLAREMNVTLVELKGSDLSIRFHEDLSRGVEINQEKLLGLVTAEPQRYRLRPDMRLLVKLSAEEAEDPAASTRKILAALR
ncbi:MAG: transcription-repair coupling factor, partial [Chrysiogenetes bacterium]|nr:transcription-repair coupling factor [Chrysiogenetes bacterium]